MDPGEQFSISFKGTIKNIFGTKGDFGNFSREHGNTDPYTKLATFPICIFLDPIRGFTWEPNGSEPHGCILFIRTSLVRIAEPNWRR